MTTSDFDAHKVDHLFLLVGENPLPNYVAARLLLEDTGTVHLVYTTQTKKRADLLKAELTKLNITVKPVELGDSSADGCKIRNKIKENIKTPKGKLLLEGRIGLNYTGGTKAMAVHAYQIFVELELDDAVFSYLDSIKLQMCIEDINNKKTASIPSALAICPEPKLEQILGLHNLSWKENKEPIYKSQFPEAAKEFIKLYDGNHSEIIQGWKDWCQILEKGKDQENGGYKTDEKLIAKLKIIEVISSNKSEKQKIPDDLKNILKEYFPDEDINLYLSKDKKEVTIPPKIQSILKDNWQIDYTEEINLQLIKNKYQINISDIYEWLNNGWLEDYVMWQVEQISKNYNIHEIKRSIHIEDPNKERKKDQFEFDVAFLRGYQLFGISCTIEHRHKDLKQKLFEAYLRAKQLGGDEARVALVCCYDTDSDNLKQELSLILGNPKDTNKKDSKDEIYDRRIEVFGRKDLEPTRFAEKLNNWIYRNM